jgi:LacI family gluconate utilization system Gnt-I transcriptional repressor
MSDASSTEPDSALASVDGRTGRAPRPRLGDVASAAGVSIVTVSRAMNSPGVVTARTRERIEAAMQEVGYVPDLVARSMAQQRTQVVAAFVPTLMDSIFASTIQGLSDAIAAAGLQLLLGNTQYSLEEEERLVRAVLGRRPDAIALTGTTHREPLRRMLAQAQIPVVEMWNLIPDPLDMAVGFSNRAAGRALTQHLIERGYRRIGYVGRTVQGNERAAARRDGYKEALRDAGLETRPEWVWEVETSMGTGEEAVEALALPHALEAIVFSGDNPAAGAILACHDRGIAVPGELAVSGFGDFEIARRVPGGLTTVRIDSYGIGRAAGEMLLRAVGGDRTGERRVDLGFEIVVRGST